MRPAIPIVLCALPLLVGGCTTSHFREHPTPENFVADGLSGVATVTAGAALVVVGAPILLVSEIGESIHSDPPEGCCTAPCPPPAPDTLPARYTPGWEAQRR